jgi:hypothetical protein
MKMISGPVCNSGKDSSLGKTSILVSTMKANRKFQRKKQSPAALKSRTIRQAKAKEVSAPLSSQQDKALRSLFERLASLESLLQGEIVEGRPGDSMLFVECVKEVTTSSLMQRRLKLRNIVAL